MPGASQPQCDGRRHHQHIQLIALHVAALERRSDLESLHVRRDNHLPRQRQLHPVHTKPQKQQHPAHQLQRRDRPSRRLSKREPEVREPIARPGDQAPPLAKIRIEEDVTKDEEDRNDPLLQRVPPKQLGSRLRHQFHFVLLDPIEDRSFSAQPS